MVTARKPRLLTRADVKLKNAAPTLLVIAAVHHVLDDWYAVDKQGVSFEYLCTALGMSTVAARAQVRNTLAQLVRDGEVRYARGHYAPNERDD